MCRSGLCWMCNVSVLYELTHWCGFMLELLFVFYPFQCICDWPNKYLFASANLKDYSCLSLCYIVFTVIFVVLQYWVCSVSWTESEREWISPRCGSPTSLEPSDKKDIFTP